MLSVIIEESYCTKELIKTLESSGYEYQIIVGPKDDYFNTVNKTVQQSIKSPTGKPIEAIINLYEECNARGQMLADMLYNQPIPCTSPQSSLYDLTRYDIKSVCRQTSTKTPKYFFYEFNDTRDSIASHLKSMKESGVEKVFIKPGRGFNSVGIDKQSCQSLMVQDDSSFNSIVQKIESVANEFGSTLVEEYIDGKEISILILPPLDHDSEPLVFKPIEFCFEKTSSSDQHFITNETKIDYEIPYWYEDVAYESEESSEAMEMVKNVYKAIGFKTYVRFDVRVRNSGPKAECFILDVNPSCSVFIYCTSVKILKANGKDNNWFLTYILDSAKNLKKLKK